MGHPAPQLEFEREHNVKEQLAEARKAAKDAAADVKPAEAKAAAAEAAVSAARALLDTATQNIEQLQRAVADADTIVKETRKSRNNAVRAAARCACSVLGGGVAVLRSGVQRAHTTSPRPAMCRSRRRASARRH